MARKEDTDSILKEIEEDLECAICLEGYNNPRNLACNHSFCLTPCLEQLVENGENGAYSYITCPECRFQTILHGEQSVSDLVRPLALQKLMRARESIKASSLTEDRNPEPESPRFKKCDVCCSGKDENKATLWCSDCDIYFCSGCSESHNKYTAFSSHNLIPLSVRESSDENNCSLHSRNYASFCASCRETVCALCILTAHKDHEIENISTAAEKLRKKQNDLFDNLREKTKRSISKQMARICRQVEKDIERNQFRVEEEILLKSTEILRDFKAELDEATECLIKKAHEQTSTQLAKLEELKESCLEVMKSQSENMDTLQSETGEYSDIKLLNNESNIDSKIEECTNETSKICLDFALPMFNPTKRTQLSVSLGSLSEDSQLNLDVELALLGEYPIQHTYIVKEPPFRYIFVEQESLLQKNLIKPKGHIMGITLRQEKKELIVTSIINNIGHIEKYSYIKGKKTGSFSEVSSQPSGLCKGRGDESNTVSVVGQDENIIQTFGPEGQLEETMSSDSFKKLLDICHISKSNLYAVTDRDSGCVHVVDLVFKQIVSTLINSEAEDWKPNYITSHKDQLAISDIVNGTITVMDAYGEIIRQDHWQPYQPGKLCYDSLGNLLVCDTMKNAIKCYYCHKPDTAEIILDFTSFGKPYLLDVYEDIIAVGVEELLHNWCYIYVFQHKN